MNKKSLQQNRSRGAAVIIFIILFVVASSILAAGISRGVFQDVIRYRALQHGKQSLYGVEAILDDAVHRFRNSMAYTGQTSLTMGGVSVTATSSIVTDHFEIEATADTRNAYRSGYLELTLGNGTSFAYGLQSDTGGILMDNSSSVVGNIYSNGSVIGTGGGSGNNVSGTVISAGPTGYLEGIHIGKNAYSHVISDTIVEEDAYCDTLTNSSLVNGLLYCDTVTGGASPNPADFPGPAADQPLTTLPLSDANIDDLKTDAAAGGVIASTDTECTDGGGTYVIDSDVTLGPVKIECDVFIDKSSTEVTLMGNIWIEGDLTTKSGPTFTIDPTTLTGKAVPIIVDNESDRVTSSRIVLQNSAVFNGAGANSYIVLISQNEDEELGGSEIAIDSGQSANGEVLLYAKHGEILIQQSGNYVGIAALLIHLENSAQVVYQTGAISLQFPDGPSSGFLITDWREI